MRSERPRNPPLHLGNRSGGGNDRARLRPGNACVVAVERSARFVASLRAEATRRGAGNIEAIEADVADTQYGDAVADALWCRWVFSWLTEPAHAVANVARALKPGGVAVFHEYLNYASWGLVPADAAFDALVVAVIASVAKTGAAIDSARALPAMLEHAGLDIVVLRPIVDVIGPANYVWQWPAAFARGYHKKLVAEGLLAASDAAAAIAALDRAESTPGTRITTPTVLEIIARRR